MPQRLRRRELQGQEGGNGRGSGGRKGNGEGRASLQERLTFAGAPEPRMRRELQRRAATGAAGVRHLQDVPVVAGDRSCQQCKAEQGAKGCAQEQSSQKGHTGKSRAAAG